MRRNLQPATTTTSLLSGGVGGDGGAVLDSADLHASSGQGSESALGAGSGGLGAVASGGSQLNVKSGDSKGLDLLSNILSSQHSSVGGRLVTVSLHLHSTGDSADGLSTREISHVHKGVVEGGVDVSNTEHLLSLANPC